MSDASVGFRLDIEWRTTVLVLLLLPLFVSLGFWQLQRAQEKRDLSATWESRRQQPPAPLAQLDQLTPAELVYLPVELSGEFLPGYFLLDNRMHHGQFGNEVLGVMQLTGSNQLVLVNRGWVAADPARLKLPEVASVTGTVQALGYVYVPPGEPYLLADQQLESTWPISIQAIDIEQLQTLLEGPLFPYSVRLDADQPGALLVDWQIVNVSPQKHTGYAVQWFCMAAALAVLYLLRSSNLLQVLRARKRIEE